MSAPDVAQTPPIILGRMHAVYPQRTRYTSKLPEPPAFSGQLEQTKLWIQQMKWHFDALGIAYAGGDKAIALSVAVTCLRGSAARWFQRLCAVGNMPMDFEDLCQAIDRQYGVIDEQKKARDALINLRQTHSVEDYIQKFEQIVVCITDINDAEMMHKFLHGLKPEIKQRLLVSSPSDLNEAMQYAQSLDDVLHPRNPYMRRNF